MRLRRNRGLSRLTMIGLCALAVANLTTLALSRQATFSESVTDPVIGFVHGVAIATTLLGIWRQARGAPPSGCA